LIYNIFHQFDIIDSNLIEFNDKNDTMIILK